MGCLSTALPVIGSVIGNAVGGPVGGAIGGGLGSLGSAALNSSGSNSGGGPSGGTIQSAFGTPNNIYSKNPAWVNQASQTNYTNASNAANQPYQPYTGQQVAPLTGNQQLAAQNAAGQLGRFSPTYGSITNYLNSSATPYGQSYTPTAVNPQNVSTTNFNQADIGSYMNPYIESALQPQINDINQDYATRQNQTNAAAAGSGNFGGSRQAVLNDLLTKQQQEEVNNVRSQGYNTAFNTAAQNFQTDQSRNLQGQLANQNAGLNAGEFNQGQNANAFNTNYGVFTGNQNAQRQAASGLNGLVNTQEGISQQIDNGLMSTGQAAQTTNQAQDQTNYQNYLNQLYYPEQQASYLQGLLGGSSGNAGSMSTGFNAGSSGTNQAIGTGTSLLNSFLGNGSIPGMQGFLGGSGGSSASSASNSYVPFDFSSDAFSI